MVRGICHTWYYWYVLDTFETWHMWYLLSCYMWFFSHVISGTLHLSLCWNDTWHMWYLLSTWRFALGKKWHMVEITKIFYARFDTCGIWHMCGIFCTWYKEWRLDTCDLVYVVTFALGISGLNFMYMVIGISNTMLKWQLVYVARLYTSDTWHMCGLMFVVLGIRGVWYLYLFV